MNKTRMTVSTTKPAQKGNKGNNSQQGNNGQQGYNGRQGNNGQQGAVNVNGGRGDGGGAAGVNNEQAKSVEFAAKGQVLSNGTMLMVPMKDAMLDAVMPELFDRFEPNLEMNEEAGMACISCFGLCQLYPDGTSAFKLFTPEMDARIMQLAAEAEGGQQQELGQQEAMPRRSRVAVRALLARTACGIVREGEDDFTLHLRVPKAMLAAMQMSFETFAEAEVRKLLAQMAIDREQAAGPRDRRGGLRRDSRGRFVAWKK